MPHEGQPGRSTRSVLLDRRFLTCRKCGWVHYVMTTEEKTANNRLLDRYQLTEQERRLYESAFRQCLRCEASADAFRAASEKDLDRAAGHLVTPVLIHPDIGTH